MYWIWYLICGGVAGWLASQLMRGRSFGIIENVLIGVAGAMIGGYLFRWLQDTAVGDIVVATLGAVLLLFIYDKLRARAT